MFIRAGDIDDGFGKDFGRDLVAEDLFEVENRFDAVDVF